jgi:hypothetical protein
MGQRIMYRFWISLPVALALAVPSAYAGKLASIEQTAKTYIAKKDTGGSSRTIANQGIASRGIASGGHGKASGFLSKGKKLLGK